MTQIYSDPSRASDPHSLPDIEIFQMTAEEVAAMVAYLAGAEYVTGAEFSVDGGHAA